MLPAFEKKPNLFVKRENQNRWDFNAVKNVSNAADVELNTVGDRDRAVKNHSNVKSRLHSRSVVRHESLQSLPTIKEPPDTTPTRTAPGSVALNDEYSQSSGPKNENLRVCVKRWKKISLSKSHTASIHFEVRTK